MTWKPCGPCRRAGRTERCTDADCEQRVTAQTAEVDAGKQAPGLPGAMYRLIDRCDYREVEGWLRGEVLRGTEERFIYDAVAAMIAASALQVAGHRSRSDIRHTAQIMMTKAALVLESDIATVIKAKKASTVLHNNIRLVKPEG